MGKSNAQIELSQSSQKSKRRFFYVDILKLNACDKYENLLILFACMFLRISQHKNMDTIHTNKNILCLSVMFSTF